jgi:hypothetical protein
MLWLYDFYSVVLAMSTPTRRWAIMSVAYALAANILKNILEITHPMEIMGV